MKHAEIIEKLDGTNAVAGALQQKLSTVSQWKKRGIPWRFRPQVARLAKERQILLPADFLAPL